MSKFFSSILFVLAVSVQILQFFTFSPAQDIETRVKIAEDAPSTVTVEGRFVRGDRPNKRNLTMLGEMAGTIGLAERFGSVELYGLDGGRVQFRRLSAGEYLADADIAKWKYRASIAPTGRASSYAHVSWLGDGRGILMGADLFPQLAGKPPFAARIAFDLPAGWELQTAERRLPDGSFDVPDIDKAVFVVSRSGSARVVGPAAGKLRLAIFDTWLFSDSDASTAAQEIADGYERAFGGRPAQEALLTIMRFPGEMRTGAWEADTRGASVAILSSDMPFRSQSVQRLHEQMRHEIFHLWIPNGVGLSGSYDWFYEGFALYRSLKMGVAANRIRFDDFLASLSQAMVIDSIQPDRISLIEASKQRWSGANTRVYARGMLAAFLCDIAMLDRSRGKRSVDDLLRGIYAKYRGTSARVDGNEAVLAEMRLYAEVRPIVDLYVTGTAKFDNGSEMLAAGIERIGENALLSLRVTAKPGRRQRDLLDKLGYNNWRKLSEGLK